jgi:uncharacterized protein (TIGR03435 family)
MKKMMQTLLADRFKLELHRQTKEVNAMVLTVAKGGHKMKEVEQEGSPSFSTGKLNLTGKGATIAQLISFLSRELRLPIVDQTGLTGRYDWTSTPMLRMRCAIREALRWKRRASLPTPCRRSSA